MHEEEQSFAKCEDDSTLKAAIDMAAMGVKKGPVALCTYIYFILVENKRLKAHVELLENDLKAIREAISLANDTPYNCNNLCLRKRVHPGTSPKYECFHSKNTLVCNKKLFEKDACQQAIPETDRKLSTLETSVGGDSGIQLSLSHSLGDLLLPQLPSSECYPELRRSNSRFSNRSLNSIRSSLFRRNSKAGKPCSTLRNSFRAVQLKSIRRKTSLDYSSEDTTPELNSQTKCLASSSFTTKSTLRETCVSEDAASTATCAPTGGALCAMTVVAQVHRSDNEEEMPEHQTAVDEEENSIQNELISTEEHNLESACPLFGCLCKACSELQLLDPGFAYCIDEYAGSPLTVGTELLVSRGGDDQQTVTVSVLYLGHAPQTSLPPGYKDPEPSLTFPVGVVALFPDGQENFVPLSNVLYIVNDALEQTDHQYMEDWHVCLEDQSISPCGTKSALNVGQDSDLLREKKLKPVEGAGARAMTNLQDSGKLMVLQKAEENIASQKYLKFGQHDLEGIYQSEICHKDASISEDKELNLYGNERAAENEVANFCNQLLTSNNFEMSLANDAYLRKTENPNNPEDSLMNDANFGQHTCFKPLSISSSLRTDTSISTPAGVEILSVNGSLICDNNSVVEAINPAFELNEQCSSTNTDLGTKTKCLSSTQCVLPYRHSLKQICECSNTFNVNHISQKGTDAVKYSAALNSCKSFQRNNCECLTISHTSTDLRCRFDDCVNKNECRCAVCSSRSCSESNCSCYNSGKNYSNIKLSAQDSCRNERCFESDECGGGMSCKASRVSVSLADSRPTDSSGHQYGNDSCGWFNNECFEADNVVTPQSLRAPDLGESLSAQGTSLTDSWKDLSFLKSSYCNDINCEAQSSTNKKIFSESIPSSDTCFQHLENFNGSPLNLHVHCLSESLEEDADESDSVAQCNFGSLKSFDLASPNVNSWKQMSSADKICSLSDRDVRISIRSTSPEPVPKTPKGGIFNRALKLLRRRSSSMAESINLSDVSNV